MSSDEYREKILSLLRDKSPVSLLPLDLKLSLFAATAKSIKKEDKTKPYPPLFRDENGKRFDDLCNALDAIPELTEITEATILPSNTWYLLHWLFYETPLSLSLVNLTEEQQVFHYLKEQTSDATTKSFRPNYVFKVNAPIKNSFISGKHTYGTTLAFHGSKPYNFHSILHNGLLNCLSERNLFGSGTYLSDKIGVAIEFSPFGFGSSVSLLGDQISCVALCEVVKEPNLMKKISKDLPESYVVVNNDDYVQVAYLLLYTKRSKTGYRESRINFYLFLSVFVVVLFAIGISASGNMKQMIRRLKSLGS